jgi:GT2 family glycosyltransferase
MPRNGPEYSIIVPTYRRREQLARCIAAIESLAFPRHRFELIVVDDGSDNPPADLISGLDRGLDAQLVCAPHGGPASARNAGAKVARGEYLVFTDDDCAPQRDWLTAIDECMRESVAPRAIGGRTVNILANDAYATASQGIVDFLYEYYGDHSAPWRFFTSNNLAMPRNEFMEVGGFDDGFPLAAAEDRDFCERWRAAGYDLDYAPNAVVDHAHKLGFTRFNKQHFAYGRGAFDLHRSRARRGQRALRLEPGRFYVALVSYPLRQSRSMRAFELSALHFWSQVAYAAGYFFERTRRGWTVESQENRDLTHADA